MKHFMKTVGMIGLILALLLTMVGCQQQTADAAPDAPAEMTYEGALAFTGLEEPFEVAYNDIYAMESITAEVDSVSSSGEERTNTVEGVLLETLLNEKGLSQKDFATIRLIAGDGYGIDVTSDILMEKDIILAYIFDGEPLDETKMPLRAAIDDVRSMYFVSNLTEVQIIRETEEPVAVESGQSKVVVLETAMNALEKQPYTYYDSEDQVIEVKQLFEACQVAEVGQVHFLAADGFEKSEDYSVLVEGVIKVNGKDSPLFTAPELPKGMNVKEILRLQVGSTTFVSAEKAIAILENRTIEEKTGVALEKFIEMAGLEGDFYRFTAADGYSVEVGKEALGKGMIHMNNSGQYKLKFDASMPKATGVKDLLSIELGDGSEAVDAGEAAATPESTPEEAGWTVTFKGLSDGSFDFGQDRAERKLTKIALHTERTKNDEKKPEDWEGYKVLDILGWLKVDTFESLTIVAQDGFEVVLTADQVDDETILADVKNGEKLDKPDNLVQLVQNTEFSNTWVKGVKEIIVD